jgi:AhpC/TSA family
MQSVLLAAVLILAVLVLVDLALTLAVVRRLRKQVTDRERWEAEQRGQVSPPLGTPVPDFTVEATDGSTVTGDTLRGGRAFVAFVSNGCGSCHDQLPQLREHLAASRAAGDYALVVVAGDGSGDGDLVTALNGAVPVVTEGVAREDRVVGPAFAIGEYPTYVLLNDGAVSGVYTVMRDVPAPVVV